MPLASSTRLNKFISESGLCSRREADRYIAEGAVLLNGKPAQIGDQVGPRDRVTVNGHKLEPKQAEDAVYLAFNKPVGITSTSEPGVRGNIVDYVNHAARVFPIGRLDKDSSGLIFLTSDGDIVNKILRAGNQHEKEYVVTGEPHSDRPHAGGNGRRHPHAGHRHQALRDSEGNALHLPHHAGAGPQPPDSAHGGAFWLRSGEARARAHHEREPEGPARGRLARADARRSWPAS